MTADAHEAREPCDLCGRPIASSHDWETVQPGKGEELGLCWEPGVYPCEDTRSIRLAAAESRIRDLEQQLDADPYREVRALRERLAVSDDALAASVQRCREYEQAFQGEQARLAAAERERDGLKAEVERLAAPLLAAGAPETEWESRYMKPTVTTHCPRCGWSAAPAAGEAKP